MRVNDEFAAIIQPGTRSPVIDDEGLPLSAATASDATTTSGFGSGLASVGQSRNSLRNLELILCCFLPNSCPHTKFHPNRTKNIEVKKIGHWLMLVGWSGQSKNSCIHLKLILFGF